MKLKEYKDKQDTPLRQATLCFMVDDDKVLLGMKKRGFAEGKWNGFGGKVDKEESILDAVIREVQEEALITPKDLSKLAVLDFYFPHNPDWNQRVFAYTTSLWDGDPTETEEMKPDWFQINDLPYKDMWVDDEHWLPHVLNGKKVRGYFLFDENENLLDHEIVFVESFND